MGITTPRPVISLGGFRELALLFAPILLMTFSTSLFLLVEKLFLARLSPQAMEAAVNVAYTCQIFYGPCLALTMMAQVFVGRWCGAQEWKSIGPGVWQFIWFSLLSMLITIPCSLVYGHYYFRDTSIKDVAFPYFIFLTLINFLFPLGATLSCFYLGQKKTRFVFCATIASQVVKLVLAYLFIFGWGWIPTLGLLGGALSTLIAQGGLCLVLLGVFINKKHAAIFNSRDWKLKPKLFWDCIHPGLSRALNRVLNFLCWAATAHLMTIKGGDFLLILSVGGTLFLFLPFIGDAIGQAQTTVVSQILGARNYHMLGRAFRSGITLALITISFVSIPLVLFPLETFQQLFPGVVLDESVIRNVFLGVWASFAFFTLTFVPLSYILAFKDTHFLLFMSGVNWISGYLVMYLAIRGIRIAADQFWLVHSITAQGVTTLFYYLRMKWLQARIMKEDSITSEKALA